MEHGRAALVMERPSFVEANRLRSRREKFVLAVTLIKRRFVLQATLAAVKMVPGHVQMARMDLTPVEVWLSMSPLARFAAAATLPKFQKDVSKASPAVQMELGLAALVTL
jgi:hypothetical protein